MREVATTEQNYVSASMAFPASETAVANDESEILNSPVGLQMAALYNTLLSVTEVNV